MEDLKRYNRVGLWGLFNNFPMFLGLFIGMAIGQVSVSAMLYIMLLTVFFIYVGTVRNYIERGWADDPRQSSEHERDTD